MSFDPARSTNFTTGEGERRHPIDELDVVRLLMAVQTEDDETVPAGTLGTVVAVWGRAEAFEVEFDFPFIGTAHVYSAQVARTERKS